MSIRTPSYTMKPDPMPLSAWLAIIPAILVVQMLALMAMGREPICTCGTVKLWHGVVQSAENSQHLFDWYSFTHVLHGLWLYFFGWLFLRRWPVAARLVLAVLLEAGWEIIENTNFVIDRYRTATVSLDYYGDSIVNSMGDTVAMISGFAMARFAPLWAAIVAVIVIEVGLIFLIKDNLFLNILMLIYPAESIRLWQATPPL